METSELCNDCCDAYEPLGWRLYTWENFESDKQCDHILDSAIDHRIGFMDRGKGWYVFIGESGTLEPWLESFGVEVPDEEDMLYVSTFKPLGKD